MQCNNAKETIKILSHMCHQDSMAFLSSPGRSRNKDGRAIECTDGRVTKKEIIFFSK
ncbi:unnamed protein product [Hymenolepis diminuta]|uniref:Uncharacterized protein n=1 Tax=Hymenolepis diminuta TaxID=6216 RepID=A0A564Y9Y1_HYMDI|nr:unnamed protein product [Hymenolepis diminuta]